MSIATTADVQARFHRDLEPHELAQAGVLLDDAELLIRAELPDLRGQVATGVLEKAAVVMVEANMVCRVLRNPEGFAQESDGNYSYMLSGQVASGRLEVLDSEWALLGVRAGVFVIAPRLDIPTHLPPAWVGDFG
ncbi:hypothetical protein D5S17_09390 [Pseudonocardiaceae bacterium YIM PH 21723]|nr:hypothetical protein D5S17_09390 [Pseudonocardiaceae bacterium YIM PH 21723]